MMEGLLFFDYCILHSTLGSLGTATGRLGTRSARTRTIEHLCYRRRTRSATQAAGELELGALPRACTFEGRGRNRSRRSERPKSRAATPQISASAVHGGAMEYVVHSCGRRPGRCTNWRKIRSYFGEP
jgi:hypothetical protein